MCVLHALVAHSILSVVQKMCLNVWNVLLAEFATLKVFITFLKL